MADLDRQRGCEVRGTLIGARNPLLYGVEGLRGMVGRAAPGAETQRRPCPIVRHVAAKLTVEEVLRLRMRSQRLTGPRPGSVPEVVRDVGALQAQSTRAARLAVRPRGRDLDGPAVNHACNVDRSVVRTWVMRGTLHMIPAADIEWMLGLYKPAADALSARERELGLDVPLLARARSAIPEVLGAGQPFTRSELIRALADHGVQVGPDGQAPAYLVAHAAVHGLICRGPDRSDDEPTYVLLSEWVGDRAQPPAARP
jgi:hypothetical protein